MLVFYLYCAFLLSYFEKSFSSNFSPTWDKSSKENNFWLTLVTMTTVGYGDGYPATHLGRFIMILCWVSGKFITSLLINTLTDSFNFSTEKAKEKYIISSHMRRKAELTDNPARSTRRKGSLIANRRLSIIDLRSASYIMSYTEFLKSLKLKIDQDKDTAISEFSKVKDISSIQQRISNIKDTISWKQKQVFIRPKDEEFNATPIRNLSTISKYFQQSLWFLSFIFFGKINWNF